jgi:serine/threonine-protein kinase
MPSSSTPKAFQPRKVGRYLLHREIAHGGMATVHIGRLLGQVGFSRTVAIKRMHEHCSRDPEFVSMFIDEARLAARIRHPNVVPTLDVVALEGELFLVMEFVQGETLARLIRRSTKANLRVAPRVASSVITGLLEGLHAAHEAVGEHGERLSIVHRDVSPQNVMVGTDGVARVLDFGVAKAANRLQTTRDGQIKGKIEYMAPEQIRGGAVDRRTDVYSAACCLWEMLTGRRLYVADNPVTLWGMVLEGKAEKPSTTNPEVSPELDAITMRGLDPDPTRRYGTAEAMAIELEQSVGIATPREVGRWVQTLVSKKLRELDGVIAELDSVASEISVPAEEDLGSGISSVGAAVPVPSDPPMPSGVLSVPAPVQPSTQPFPKPQTVAKPRPPVASSPKIEIPRPPLRSSPGVHVPTPPSRSPNLRAAPPVSSPGLQVPKPLSVPNGLVEEPPTPFEVQAPHVEPPSVPAAVPYESSTGSQPSTPVLAAEGSAPSEKVDPPVFDAPAPVAAPGLPAPSAEPDFDKGPSLSGNPADSKPVWSPASPSGEEIGDVVLPVRRSRVGWMVAGAVGILAVVAGVLVMGLGGENAGPVPSRSAPDPVVSSVPEVSLPAPEAAPSDTPPDAQAATVRLRVEVSPRTAKVTVDGVERADRDLRLPVSSNPVKVVAEAPGFVAMERSFVPSTDGVIVLELKRVPASTKPTATVEIKGPVETEL